MTTRKLTELHVRWSQFLSQFNFRLNYRCSKKGERPDAPSCREQIIPQVQEDPRLKEREFQMIDDNLWKSPGEVLSNISLSERNKIPKGASLLEDAELQNLWNKATQEDTLFNKLYESLWQNDRSFPSELGLKTSLL